MGRRQCVCNLHRVLQCLARFQALRAPSGPDQLVEGLALDVLHGNEVHAVGGVDVVKVEDVRVVEGRSRLGLLHKASLALGMGDGLSRQHLDGHRPVEMGVTGFINNPHAPFAQF